MEGLLAALMFVALAVLLMTGYPVGLVLAGVGVLFAFIGHLAGQFHLVQLYAIVPRIWGGAADNLLLVAVPMFIFMGTMLERSAIAEDLLRCLQILMRRLPGGLALAVVGLGTVLAAMTGIIGASVILLSLLTLPPLLERRYDPALAAGTIAASGTLGILVPPSIMLVVMAEMIGVSVGRLFLAAVLPGLLLAGLYFVYVLIIGLVSPARAPAPCDDLRTGSGLELALLVLRSLVPPVVLIAAVLGSIFAGIATVTEASGVGAFGATLLALLKGRLDLASLRDVLDRSTRTVAMVFLVIIGATTFAYVFRILGGDGLIRGAVDVLGLDAWGTLVLFMTTVFLLGFFFDWIEVTLIVLPLFVPVVRGLDFAGHIASPRDVILWFGMLVAINLQTSFLTPPFGFALFYLKGVAPAAVRIGHIYRGVVPFVALQLVALAMVMAIPDLALWLPRRVLP